MSRLTTLLFLILTTYPALGEVVPSSQISQRPNFVLIILDDWGWRESGAYGNPHIQTPNIDRLAREGAQFNNAFLTASTCSPSRASMPRGLHPFPAGVPRLHVPTPPDKKLVTSYLQKAGYFTASIGKWHMGDNVLDQFDLIMRERYSTDHHETGMEDWLPVLEHKIPKGKPFFIRLAAKDAHRPWFHDPEWSVHLPEHIEIPAYIEFNKKFTPEVIRQEMAMYYDEIRRADFYIGQVLATLKRQQRLENTVIIVMSDNGSPFWKAKKFLTDPGLKTPFIVYWPRSIKQHTEVNELISAVDIAPTLFQLAGIEVPAQMEGTSFAHWLTKPQAPIKPIREFVCGERGDGVLGAENGRSIPDKR